MESHAWPLLSFYTYWSDSLIVILESKGIGTEEKRESAKYWNLDIHTASSNDRERTGAGPVKAALAPIGPRIIEIHAEIRDHD